MVISAESAPALGDVRALAPGQTIWLMPGAEQRKDWGRYTEAFAQAVARGADVRWIPRCVGCGEIDQPGCLEGLCCR